MANTPTPYYAINKPASGDTGWGTTMNANMDTIDTALQGMAQLAGRTGGQTLYGGTAANDDITIGGTSHGTKTTSYVILQPTGGRVGIRTSAPALNVDIAATSMLLGADSVDGISRTNATDKKTWLVGPHYLNAEEYAAIVGFSTGSTYSIVDIGGGTSDFNAATNIRFFTASNYNTVTGTERMRILSTGEVGIGTITPSNKLTVVGSSQAYAGGAISVFATGGTSTDEQLQFGVYDANYSWIQAVKPGTAFRSLLLNPNGGRVGVGTAVPDSILHATVSTANTATIQQLLTLSANSTGTAATGFGSRILWELESSTTDDRTAAALDVYWWDATDATRSSWINLQTVHSGSLVRWLHNYADATAVGYNIFMGRGAGNFTMSPAGGAATLSSYNIGLGYVTLSALTTGSYNVAIGSNSSKTFTTGQQNTAIGYATLFTAPTGASGNVAIGYGAGYYETGSSKLFIDNTARASEADGRAKALIYGVFDAATANQTLALNAVVTVLEGLKVTNGSAQIGGTAARSGTAGTNRLDVFDGTAPVGTLANGVSIYSTTGECYIMDAAGNATLQSPHDLETGEWIFWSRNTVTGRTYRVDMERMVAAIEALTGQKFTTETFN